MEDPSIETRSRGECAWQSVGLKGSFMDHRGNILKEWIEYSSSSTSTCRPIKDNDLAEILLFAALIYCAGQFKVMNRSGHM